ncbi:MAG: glutamine transporter substrate-binding protein [Bacillales bacterium]|nr:glutamine transporter substrate-binding protein [Bacillales bacterium]
MKTKKLFMGLTSLLLAFTVVGCGKKEEEKKETSEDTKKKIVVATDAAYAPFEYLESGKIVGFDVDLLGEVLKEAGYEYEFKNTGWDPLFPAVQNKQVDMAASALTITDKRKETYNFSHPYFQSTFMIMVKEGSTIKSALDLKNAKIGVQNGTTGQEAVEGLIGTNAPNIKKYENNVLAVMALKSGEVEAVVTDFAVAAEYVKNNPNDKIVAIEDKTNFASEFYGFMFPKDSTKLQEEVNKAYNTILDNGTYAELFKKYFGTEPDIESLKKEQ